MKDAVRAFWQRARLLASAMAVSFMTVLSRITGLVRDVLIAATFGAGLEYDAFVVATKIPNFFRRIFGEGAFANAFVPLFAQYKEQNRETETFLSNVIGLLLLALWCTTMLVIVSAPLMILLFAPGFEVDDTRFVLATTLLRFTAPYLMFISMAALFSSVMNAYGRFAVPAFAPCMSNVGMVLGMICLAGYFPQPIHALAVGVSLGGAFQLITLWPSIRRLKIHCKLSFNWRYEGVRRLLGMMGPAVLGVSAMQINVLVDSIFASRLPVGSLSWLSYAERMSEFPYGVFGVALATVVLPHLSSQIAMKSYQAYNNSLDWALRVMMVISVPAAAGLFCLAGPIMTTAFHYGEFGAHDVAMSAAALKVFALALLASFTVKIVATAFYARQDLRTPVIMAFVAVGVNVVGDILLYRPYGHVGITVATALATALNAGCLLTVLIRTGCYQPRPGWWAYLGRLLLATMLMVLFLNRVAAPDPVWLDDSLKQRVCMLAGIISTSALIYFATLWVSGLRWRELIEPSPVQGS